MPAAALERGFEVLDAAWEVVTRLWPEVQMEWRVAPMGGVLGLDKPGVVEILKAEVGDDYREAFRQIRIMERIAVPIFNDKLKPKTTPDGRQRPTHPARNRR